MISRKNWLIMVILAFAAAGFFYMLDETEKAIWGWLGWICSGIVVLGVAVGTWPKKK
jgi:hypothetical protein